MTETIDHASVRNITKERLTDAGYKVFNETVDTAEMKDHDWGIPVRLVIASEEQAEALVGMAETFIGEPTL